MSLKFHLIDWRGWDSTVDPTPCSDLVPAMLRRRLTPLGRSIFSLALPLVDAYGNLPIVFASRHGESSKTLQLLDEIAQNEPVSPTAFSLSVHNASAGVLAIHTDNHQSINAIAAGREDLYPAMIEALGMSHAFHSPVLCLFGDSPLPDAYRPLFADDCTGYSFAMVVEPGASWEFCSETAERDQLQPGVTHSLAWLRLLKQGGDRLTLADGLTLRRHVK